MMFKEKQKGMECQDNADGTRECKRFISKKGNAYATGSDFKLIPDPTTCKVRVVGRIMDEDREAVEIQIKEVENKCKKGI